MQREQITRKVWQKRIIVVLVLTLSLFAHCKGKKEKLLRMKDFESFLKLPKMTSAQKEVWCSSFNGKLFGSKATVCNVTKLGDLFEITANWYMKNHRFHYIITTESNIALRLNKNDDFMFRGKIIKVGTTGKPAYKGKNIQALYAMCLNISDGKLKILELKK